MNANLPLTYKVKLSPCRMLQHLENINRLINEYKKNMAKVNGRDYHKADSVCIYDTVNRKQMGEKINS